jgi:hypothetical protein
MADRIEEAGDVGIQNPVHLGAGDPDSERVERIVGAAAGSEPVRESVTDIRSELGISSTTWERLGTSMRDTTSALAKRLVAQGVVCRVEQAGKVRRGYLVKND